MFGSASQKAAFSFGNSSNNSGAGSNSTPTFNSSNSSTNKPGNFSFGSSNVNANTLAPSSTLGFSLNSNNANKPTLSSSNSFSLNKTATNTAGGLSTGFNFGNNNNSSNLLASTSNNKPALFGNSSTNPIFGNNSSNMGLVQTQLQQQNQNNSTPYGFDLAKLASTEMPAPITTESSDPSLKRKRSKSVSETKGESSSLVGHLVDSFKAPSKYSIESVRGLFTSTRNLITNNSKQENNIAKNKLNSDDYFNSMQTAIPNISTSKSEYKRLVIKNPRDTFANFEEIDANQVFLNKEKNFQYNTLSSKEKPESNFIHELKPPSKRVKTSSLCVDETLDIQQITESSHNNINQLDNTGKDEYWCNPSIEELSKLTSLELAHVQNFTIGRKDHGNLMFKYPVDLTEFEGKWDTLLGKTVIFEKKTLQVYPSGVAKPSQGNGMNVPAIITLEKVYPKRYDCNNPDYQMLEIHIKKLKAPHGMKFISFDPSTGNYVFEVQHFSIWGIVDEDDDDPEIVEKWRKQQELESNNEKRKNELQVNALERIVGYGHPGDNWKRQKFDFALTAPGSLEFEKQNERSNNNKDEDTSEDDGDDNQNFADERDDDEPIVMDALVPNGMLNNDNDNDINKNFDLDLIPKDIDELVEVRAYEPEVKDIDMEFINRKPKLSHSKNWDEQLSLTNGFFSVFNKTLNEKREIELDAKAIGDLIFQNKSTSNLKKAIIQKPTCFEFQQHYKECLQLEIRNSIFLTRKNNYPLVKIGGDVSLTYPLTSFEGTEDYNVWELLSILYDDSYLMKSLTISEQRVGRSSFPKLKHILDLKRREQLCDFLQKIISLDLERNIDISCLDNDIVDKIYYFLCTNRLGDAIQYAINTKNNHLAVLLTMLDSNDNNIHSLAKSQLNEWTNGVISFIPGGVLKIYKLLSGSILGKEYINHLQGLAWPVVLFLLVKYGDSNKLLSETISEFLEFSDANDLCDNSLYSKYHLIFRMVNSSKDSIKKFDLELQFLLIKHLRSFIECSDEEFDRVIEKFSEELENKQMIEEAIYVLEHLTNDEKIAELMPRLLEQHVTELGFLDNKRKMDEIHQSLQIPVSLLHEARSYEFNERGEYYKSALELILADNLIKSHQLVLEKVAPEVIIAGVKSQMDNFLKLIDEFSTLEESKVGIDIYGDYIKAIKLTDDLDSEEISNKKYEVVKNVLQNVISVIPLLVENNPKIKIAKTIMLRKLLSAAFKSNIKLDFDQLERLSLPESEHNYLETRNVKNEDVKLLTN